MATGAEDERADCEEAELVLAAREVRTLLLHESTALAQHLAHCDRCRAAAATPSDDDWRWVARMPASAFGTQPQLPIVDPQVYAVERELASGGMGRVSLATDLRLGRKVALKEILDPRWRARFEREAFITAHLQHPAIIPIYEAGTWPDGAAFYTMRHVSGTTLQGVLDASPALDQRLALLPHVIATVEAIAYAHGHRVIHRDLKTTNVLVGELGDTVVIDWGLAKQLDAPAGDHADGEGIPSSGELTRHGSVLGTPYFMAPEQARGETVDERTDVFALGAILYTLLAGAPPFSDGGAEDAIARVAAGPPRSLAALAPSAPADLVAICERAMAHDAGARYPTARELAGELRRFEAGQLVARPYRMRELIARWVRRHRTAIAVAAVALISVAIVAVFAIVDVTRSREAERSARRDAEAARFDAEAREATVLEEQGRVAVLAGEHDRALALLTRALRLGRDNPTIRFLVGTALRDRELLGTAATRVEGVAAAILPRGNDPPLVLSRRGVLTQGDRVIATVPHEVHLARFARDGAWVVVAGPDGLARYDVGTGARVWRRPRAEAPELEDKRLVIAPDQTWLLGARDRTATAIRADTGAVVGAVTVAADITTIAISPGGDTFAIADLDGCLEVFSSATRERISRRCRLPLDNLAYLDNRTIAGSNLDGTLWHVEDRPPIILPHAAPVAWLATVVPRRWVVTATKLGYVNVWNHEGALVASQAGVTGTSFAISDDGSVLLALSGDTIAGYFLPGLEPAFSLASGRVHDVWSSQGTFVARLGDRARALRVPRRRLRAGFDARRGAMYGNRALIEAAGTSILTNLDGETVAAVAAPPTSVAHIVWSGEDHESRDGRRRLIATREGAMVWDVGGGKAVAKLDVGTTVAALAPSGRVAAFMDKAMRLRVLDGETGAAIIEQAYPDLRGRPDQLAFLSDRELLVRRREVGWELWDPATLRGRSLALDPAARYPFVATSNRIVLFGRSDKRVTVHDPNSGAEVATFVPGSHTQRIRASAAGDVYALQGSHAVEVFAVDAPERARARIGAVGRALFALSGDGRRLFTAYGGVVSTWEADSGRLLGTVRSDGGEVTNLELSSDGSTLLVDAASVSLWDVTLDATPVEVLGELVERSGVPR